MSELHLHFVEKLAEARGLDRWKIGQFSWWTILGAWMTQNCDSSISSSWDCQEFAFGGKVAETGFCEIHGGERRMHFNQLA